MTKCRTIYFSVTVRVTIVLVLFTVWTEKKLQCSYHNLSTDSVIINYQVRISYYRSGTGGTGTLPLPSRCFVFIR